jgi:hemoglobin-like flavoprotein
MSETDAELIERSLLTLAESGTELRHGLFARFFQRFPERRKDFLAPEATSVRMTDETLQMLYGLASGETWVWPLIAELVATHRSYGRLPLSEYEGFVDLLLDELGETLGSGWTAPVSEAWRRQGERLKAMIAEASADWERILPQSGAARA